MDSTANLKSILDLADLVSQCLGDPESYGPGDPDAEAARLARAVLDLHVHLVRGGSLPTQWRNPAPIVSPPPPDVTVPLSFEGTVVVALAGDAGLPRDRLEAVAGAFGLAQAMVAAAVPPEGPPEGLIELLANNLDLSPDAVRQAWQRCRVRSVGGEWGFRAAVAAPRQPEEPS